MNKKYSDVFIFNLGSVLSTHLLLKNAVYLQNHVTCPFPVDKSCMWPQMCSYLCILMKPKQHAKCIKPQNGPDKFNIFGLCLTHEDSLENEIEFPFIINSNFNSTFIALNIH